MQLAEKTFCLENVDIENVGVLYLDELNICLFFLFILEKFPELIFSVGIFHEMGLCLSILGAQKGRKTFPTMDHRKKNWVHSGQHSP